MCWGFLVWPGAGEAVSSKTAKISEICGFNRLINNFIGRFEGK